MLYLLLSILLSAYLGIAFKYFHRYGINSFQAIVYNYITCVITGCIVLGQFPLTIQSPSAPWFAWSILMGALFITVFNMIAISTQRVGVTITQTANKLSLIIPVIMSVILYNESLNYLKIIGLLLAIIAVILTTASGSNERKILTPALLFPIALFIGSGIIDTLTKYVQVNFITTSQISNQYLITGFLTAATIGGIFLMYQFYTGKQRFSFKNVIAGILLGIPNYFSIYYLVRAFQDAPLQSTALIPINNIGIFLVSTLFGITILHEKLSRKNYLGILLAFISILILFLADWI